MAPRHLRTIVATALVLATAPLLTSCSSVQLAFGSTAGGAFAAIDEFRADDALPAPSWVPDDASSIRYTTDLGDHASILMYQSATHFAPGTCDLMSPAASSTAVSDGVPLNDSWWPDAIPDVLFGCEDGWKAFADGDTVYAFTLGSPSDAPAS